MLEWTGAQGLAPQLTIVEGDTVLTVGAVVSMTMSFALPRLPTEPGVASVSVASFVAASAIVPPLRPSEPLPV